MKKFILIGLMFMVLVSVGFYNDLVSSETSVKSYWAQVENQMQRRADLVPNLVRTVSGYSLHEGKIMHEVTDARIKLGQAATPKEKLEANEKLNSSLSKLLVVVENYPNLKANEQFQSLMVQLEGTENRMAVARKDYVQAVNVYNLKVKKFPSNVFASMFGFTELPQFEASSDSKEVPKVEFK